MNGWELINRKKAALLPILQDMLWCLPLPFLMNTKVGADFYVLGPAYYLAMQSCHRRWPIAALAAALGVLLLPGSDLRWKYGLILALATAQEAWLQRHMPLLPFWKRCLFYEAAMALAMVILSVWGIVSQYQMVSLILEGVLLMAAACLYQKTMQGLPMKDELSMAGFSLVIGTVLSTFHFVRLGSLIPAEVLLLTLSLLTGYRYAVGASLALTMPAAFFMRLTYTASEGLVMLCLVLILLVAAFREMGRRAAALAAFSGGSLWIMLIMGGSSVVSGLLSLAAACLAALLVPSTLFGRIAGKTGGKESGRCLSWIHYVTAQMAAGAQAYQEVAALIQVPGRKRRISSQDLIYLKEDIATGLCQDCPGQRLCWGRLYARTHNAVVCVMQASQQKGKVQRADLPAEFLETCRRPTDFVRTVNRHFELYRLNQSWENRMAQSAKMIQNQYLAMASYMQEIQSHLAEQIEAEEKAKQTIQKELKRQGFLLRDLWVQSATRQEGLHIELIMDRPLTTRQRRQCETVLSQIAGGPIRMLKARGNRYFFGEVNRLKVRLGHMGWSREAVSGDSYMARRLDEQRYLVALGDGMGSGMQAHEQSERALALLEQLLLTGLDETQAIRQLNALLLLSSQEEIFTTIDLAIINVSTGALRLVKAGSCITFVRSRAAVYVYHSQSLPVGILGEPEPETFDHQMQPGDVLVMISDGVLDQLPDPALGERVIRRYLMQETPQDPAELAGAIQQRLRQMLAEEPQAAQAEDDRTILAVQIEKRGEL